MQSVLGFSPVNTWAAGRNPRSMFSLELTRPCPACIAEGKQPEARRHCDAAVRLWDGKGFLDAAARQDKRYSTYKLGLALMAASRLSPPARAPEALVERLLALQDGSGGWITDYDAPGKRIGLANVETTCLAVLGLEALKMRVHAAKSTQGASAKARFHEVEWHNGRRGEHPNSSVISPSARTLFRVVRRGPLNKTVAMVRTPNGRGFSIHHWKRARRENRFLCPVRNPKTIL